MTNLYSLNQHLLEREYVPNEMEDEILFYQYKDPHYRNQDGPWLNTYKAYRETPKGYWVVKDYDHHGDVVNTSHKKWIRKQDARDRTQKKLFAYRRKDDALYSYYRKKLEHLRYLEIKHNHLKTIVRRIENENDFFGTQRLQIDHIDRFIFRSSRRQLKPLERKRYKTDFIEEMEMEL